VDDKLFSGLSSFDKVLYGMLLDKMSEAMSHQWVDEENRMYIIYPLKEMEEDLQTNRKSLIGGLNALENIGLIERKRQGRGNANRIYVKNFVRQVMDE
jgi:predicted transcriptional regulator